MYYSADVSFVPLLIDEIHHKALMMMLLMMMMLMMMTGRMQMMMTKTMVIPKVTDLLLVQAQVVFLWISSQTWVLKHQIDVFFIKLNSVRLGYICPPKPNVFKRKSTYCTCVIGMLSTLVSSYSHAVLMANIIAFSLYMSTLALKATV